ncbi:hypothetical protein H6G65_08330 [Microcystis elabens FACHB-917]|nr:hypothetical protein [Microcystis elabens FACHB-917]
MQAETSPESGENPFGFESLRSLQDGRFEQTSYSRSQVLLKERDSLNAELVIIDGIVKVRSCLFDGSENVLGILVSGECISIASVFGAVRSLGDVVSITPRRLIRLPWRLASPAAARRLPGLAIARCQPVCWLPATTGSAQAVRQR